MKHEIKLTNEHFEQILLGNRTFLSWNDSRHFEQGDTLVLIERIGETFTGRVIEATVTDVHQGRYSREGCVLISFQILFPVTEPKIPISTYMELWSKWLATVNELEALKAEMAV